MKRQVLFVQGAGAGVHDEWDSRLVASLRQELGQAWEIHYPRMPREEDPDPALWKPALEAAIGMLRDGGILVAHSVGATILLSLLTEQPASAEPGAVFLIAAPFVGEGGWPAGDLRFPPDLGARLPAGVPIHLYHGLDDDVVPPAHVELHARAIPQARVHRLPGRNHQLDDDLKEIAAQILSLEERA